MGSSQRLLASNDRRNCVCQRHRHAAREDHSIECGDGTTMADVGVTEKSNCLYCLCCDPCLRDACAKHAAFHVSDAPRRRPESLRLQGDDTQGPWPGLYLWEALLQLVYGSGPTHGLDRGHLVQAVQKILIILQGFSPRSSYRPKAMVQ